MGAKREEIITEKDKRLTAYHEVGHALVAWLTPDADPVHKVTIIPRGRALGVTQFLPEEDRVGINESEVLADLAVALGGRAAERLIFDDLTAGAAGRPQDGDPAGPDDGHPVGHERPRSARSSSATPRSTRSSAAR